MSKWSKSQDAQLIRLVAQQRVLYDAAAPDHRNLLVKHHAWSDISVALDIPVPAIKKRWKHFRDHYRKKERQSQTNIKNNWEYMPLLGFLSSVNTDNQESEAQPSNVEDVTDAEDVNVSRESHSNQGTEHPLISNKRKDNDLSEKVTEETKEVERDVSSPKIESEFHKNTREKSNLFYGKRRRRQSEGVIYRIRKSIINKEINDALRGLDNNLLNYKSKSNENIQESNLQTTPDHFTKNYKDMFNKILTRVRNETNHVVEAESTEFYEDNKRQKLTRELNSEEDLSESGEKRDKILKTLSGIRGKFQDIVLDLEKCVDKTGSYARVRKKAHVSPIHTYFEVVADILAMFPPHLIAKTRLKTCKTINHIEECLISSKMPKDPKNKFKLIKKPL